ncbi:MAG: 50S ribosomal protein L11 methyltransferase [Deltaproteobacteria bacterium]|nr:50S ribosomal protein L11 methyltransferase [Deltaproteobacteria bacterium]MBW2120792.1 50S ribosomal protein L11 methyltransferase [Deltaproteobacteria bacterium]
MGGKTKPEKGLKEIVAVVPREASEAVENFLIESGAIGTSIESFELEGPTETVRAYFPQGRSAERLEARLGAYVKAIEGYFPGEVGWNFSVQTLVEDDWQQAWRAFFKTSRVSRRIVIKPPWESYEPKGEERVVEIDPGMAFGTGIHETTRLCLEVLDREIDRRLGKARARVKDRVSLLDVGTGSGVLAIAGARLGARPVKGIDVDERALEAAFQNVRRNRVEEVVEIGSDPLEAVSGRFDLVVANIDFKTLARLEGPLTAHVAPRGRLILSGVLNDQVRALAGIFEGRGFEVVGGETEGEWSCLVLRRLMPSSRDSPPRRYEG